MSSVRVKPRAGLSIVLPVMLWRQPRCAYREFIGLTSWFCSGRTQALSAENAAELSANYTLATMPGARRIPRASPLFEKMPRQAARRAGKMSVVKPSRTAIGYAHRLVLYCLLILVPVAQQAALRCCLPCVLGQHETRGPSAQGQQPGHLSSEPACETCGSCGDLVAALPSAVPVVALAQPERLQAIELLQSQRPISVFRIPSRAPPALA